MAGGFLTRNHRHYHSQISEELADVVWLRGKALLAAALLEQVYFANALTHFPNHARDCVALQSPVYPAWTTMVLVSNRSRVSNQGAKHCK